MADKSKPVEAASAAPGEKRSVSPQLARASESGDPAVQKVLGDLNAAQQNLSAASSAQAAVPAAQAAVQDAKARLAELGFE